MAQTLLKEIDYIFDNGEVQYIQVDVISTDQPQSAYANAHVRIVQADLTGKQTFDNLNKNVIAGLALKKARDYFANITEPVADTADTATTADTEKVGG
ncbi:hypothetical protein [Limosilactobacillus equigenerosi]|uniref:Uncharacterized protein n=1 Tax=Limosilactobacillus equigenerosi DSM 18793 = JCM 14505 TaxID=1423742 RepID=A0A0R1UEJ1_9LACO|nr:hypothetical protein [Limosilactobacillus equigenerosi]KRL91841.1 hypothetical protein FC21_GL000611 [Limosilactobacillus equigenerosi DSM 18793 = JCM 14505]